MAPVTFELKEGTRVKTNGRVVYYSKDTKKTGK
jgi:hypothetical protein